MLETITSYCGTADLALAFVVLILFFIQFRYYAVRYRYLLRARRKNAGKSGGVSPEPVSLLTVVVETNYSYLEETLPNILAQEHDLFEVVLVDLTDDVDFSESLKLVALNNRRINLIKLTVMPMFPISNKMALNVAVKAARYDNVLISTTDILPPGPHWLARMGGGFAKADIVLGYNTMERRRGDSNAMIRLSNAETTMRWINSALRGRPYRGTLQNLGFKRKLYFDHNGFNHLNLNIGEEDLFIQYISRGAKTCVIVDRDAAVCERVYGGAGWWARRRLLRSNAFRHYPRRAKRYIAGELWSRVLFFASVIAAVILLPLEMKAAALALLLLRYIIVFVQTVRTGRALGERRIWASIPVYDLLSPFYEARLAIARRLKKTPGLWR